MDKILSITEIFSKHRLTFELGQGQYTDNKEFIHEFKEEIVKINGSKYQMIVGYGHKDKKLFQFRKESVNIIFA